jgi:hypothetical protein
MNPAAKSGQLRFTVCLFLSHRTATVEGRIPPIATTPLNEFPLDAMRVALQLVETTRTTSTVVIVTA